MDAVDEGTLVRVFCENIAKRCSEEPTDKIKKAAVLVFGKQTPNPSSAGVRTVSERLVAVLGGNGVYRTSTPKFLALRDDDTQIQPQDVAGELDAFYRNLAGQLEFIECPPEDGGDPTYARRYEIHGYTLAEVLADADYTLESVINPWKQTDLCGAHATAMVIWVSFIAGDGQLPVFGTKSEHYEAMFAHDPIAHAAYYEECLARYERGSISTQ